MARFKVSPEGEFLNPWINKADTKFNDDGLYQVDLIVEGEDAQDFREALDQEAEVIFAEKTDKMTPGEKKKWGKYVPYVLEEDDEGNPTGRTIFSFKQNAKIKLRDGTIKNIKIELRDSDNEVVSAQVYGGTVGRILYSTRAIEVASTKLVGPRLDFAKVQIIQLSEGSGGGGFGKVEGGFKGSKGSNEQPADTDEQGGEY